MNNQKLKKILFFIGLGLFHLFFWREKQGLNTVFFALFTIGILYYDEPIRWQSTYFKATALGTFLLSLFVVWNHSDMAIICYWVSFTLLIGTSLDAAIYYSIYALAAGMFNILDVKKNFEAASSKNINHDVAETSPTSPLVEGLRPSLFVIPFFILMIFIVFYMIGNQAFANNMFNFFALIFRNLDWLRDLFSLQWVAFMMVAFLLVGSIFYKNVSERWRKAQQNHIFDIPQSASLSSSTEKINDKYWVAFLTLAMLNVLILIVNMQEFVNIANNEQFDASSLKYSVHFGTYVLIFSIVAAMILLIRFFRGDLNFIEKSPALKLLAYVWITQNAIMVITVALRNYGYISHYGLAYKRIGVIFFLLLVLFGLYTMILKVKNNKTFNYLFHLNSWAVYGLFILISAINWDNFITRYNLSHHEGDKIDAYFLIKDISDKNLKTLFENKEKLPKQINHHENNLFFDNDYQEDTQNALENKKHRFLSEDKPSFFSWNYPDAENRKYFKNE
jgi:Domain of unknown function (DUF4173)